jgi:hypothetical protein
LAAPPGSGSEFEHFLKKKFKFKIFCDFPPSLGLLTTGGRHAGNGERAGGNVWEDGWRGLVLFFFVLEAAAGHR